MAQYHANLRYIIRCLHAGLSAEGGAIYFRSNNVTVSGDLHLTNNMALGDGGKKVVDYPLAHTALAVIWVGYRRVKHIGCSARCPYLCAVRKCEV